tara:strand:- start:584 stop:1561 length:978 start_codon:yes stop_codon:yes gene_type:complete
MVKLNWYHTKPKDYYPECVKMFGKPTALSTARHGFAYWKTKGLFDEHLLRDEDVKHCVPRPHHDYFYSSVKFFVPEDKFCDVLKVSGSLAYDGLKKLLTARCGGIGANYATIYLGMMIAQGKLTLKQVQSGDMYPKMIRGELIPHNKLHKIMYKLKKENNKKYKKQIKDDFATYAFDKCYTGKDVRSSRKSRKTKKKRKTAKKSGGATVSTRKHRGGKKEPMNTRGEKCSKKHQKAKHSWTSCCPHMDKDSNGKYRATNEKNIISYDGHKYELWTCCQMCADAMIKTAKNTSKFKKQFVHHMEGDVLVAKNQHTGEIVQKLQRVK